MRTYAAFLLDSEGHWITESTFETAKVAKDRCRYWLSDDYARSSETTHENWGTEKAEVWCLKHDKWHEPTCAEIREKGECVWDEIV